MLHLRKPAGTLPLLRAAATTFLLAACAAAILGTAADPTRADPGPGTVVVRITSGGLEVAPVNVVAGPLLFKIANKGALARNFAIGGKRTAQISPGQSATLMVTLTKGFQSYSSVRPNRRGRITGLLDALEPCTNPVATTIAVQMDHPLPITVSQSTIPCGTVTFIVTNIGSQVDDLHVFADLPQEKGATPELSPGQTADLTIEFVAKGSVHYESGDFPPAEPEYGGDPGDQGQLTIV